MALVSVSVDLDPLAAYHSIHGLAPPPAEQAGAVMARALPRFLDLFARYRIQATFFVVGQDVADPGVRALLQQALRAGHELANHSHTHPYDLARLSREQIETEVSRCDQALRALGTVPQGFRCPGYDMSTELCDVLHGLGYRYDSSILPSPPYYLAKTLVLAGMGLLGRKRSGAVMTAPRALLAPADPYRMDPEVPFRPGQGGLVELPIAVTPGLRLWAIGTSLVLSERLRIHLLSAMRRRPFFNLELHGIDLIDADEDGVAQALRKKQPDLRVPLKDKWRALCASFDAILLEREAWPLCQVAAEVQRTGGVHFSLGAGRGLS